MTDWKTRCFSLARLFGAGSALVVTVWLTAAVAAPAQTFTTLVNFDGTNGAGPEYVSLVQGRDGNFYGTTMFGGISSNTGTVFKITSRGTLTTLYSFCSLSSCADGEGPMGALLQATSGSFYGTTALGGANKEGTVFRITPKGSLTTLYSFCSQTNCSDGSVPVGALVQFVDGNLYGATEEGGDLTCNAPYGCGTVFEISAEGALTTLHVFRGLDGALPTSGLIQAADGSFYGTTSQGGTDGFGTVFKITREGTLTTLHSFDVSDGAIPYAGLALAADGSFYGTTGQGGIGGGTVFKITPCGKLTTLYSFCAETNCTDGRGPWSLVQATDGKFYGTTYAGGTDFNDCYGFGCGTVFNITSGGTLATLHSFHVSDGANPIGGLLQATTGTLYGTTALGGPSNDGTIFSLDMGLGPFVAFVRGVGRVGTNVQILGQGFTGTTGVSFNGTPASYTVKRDTYLVATVPQGATTGYVTVTTPSGTLTSNVPFRVRP